MEGVGFFNNGMQFNQNIRLDVSLSHSIVVVLGVIRDFGR